MLFFDEETIVRLSYRLLEDLLSELHAIAPASRSALRGRIKHFQRNGWPGGTNTGKGTAASYDFGAVLKLALGFELLQLGVTPERAVILLRDNWQNIRTAMALAVNAHEDVTTIERDGRPPFDVFLYCDPQALASLSEPSDDGSDDTFFYTSAPQLARNLAEHRSVDVRRLALINLSLLIDDIIELTGDAGDFRESWIQWDDAEREADRETYKAESGVYPEDDHPEDPGGLLPPEVRRR